MDLELTRKQIKEIRAVFKEDGRLKTVRLSTESTTGIGVNLFADFSPDNPYGRAVRHLDFTNYSEW